MDSKEKENLQIEFHLLKQRLFMIILVGAGIMSFLYIISFRRLAISIGIGLICVVIYGLIKMMIIKKQIPSQKSPKKK